MAVLHRFYCKLGGSNGKVDTIKSGWSVVYIEKLQVIIYKKCISLKIDFALANSADLDEMPPYTVFHLSPHCLS